VPQKWVSPASSSSCCACGGAWPIKGTVLRDYFVGSLLYFSMPAFLKVVSYHLTHFHPFAFCSIGKIFSAAFFTFQGSLLLI
jgi:hypothetical protein